MTNEELISELIDAAYDSGYYDGIDDTNYEEAMKRQSQARHALRQHINDLEASIACDQVTIADLEAKIRRLEETGIAFIEELKAA